MEKGVEMRNTERNGAVKTSEFLYSVEIQRRMVAESKIRLEERRKGAL